MFRFKLDETVQSDGSRPFVLFDATGAPFQPVRNYNRSSGVSAFRIKPRGAGNKADEAIETEDIVDVARAMLVDGLASRVKAIAGGPVNYLTYGGDKLVRYELPPEIAQAIGVPPRGGVNGTSSADDGRATDAKIQKRFTPMNLILYGPPGTGKTFTTAAEAVRPCGEPVPADAAPLPRTRRRLACASGTPGRDTAVLHARGLATKARMPLDALSPDIALNQVMRAAVRKLSRLSGAPENQRALRELSFVYADVADVPPNALRWDRIVLDRTNRRWRDLLTLARLFLSDRHQQTSAGTIDGHALLFEMNVLFEAYIERILSRALAGTGFRVSSQGGHRDCLYEGETGRFRTRPDLIIRRGERIALIIDTKWKRMTPRIDDPKQGVSQADVYQLMAYGRLYDCPNVVLLYPHHGDLPPDPIRRRYSIATRGADESLIVATQDLTGKQRDHTEALRQLVMDCLARESAQEAPDNLGSALFEAI